MLPTLSGGRLVRCPLALALGAIILAVLGPAFADEIVLGPAKDNTMFEDPAGLLSNGAGQYLICGSTVEGLNRRALLEFDIAGAIPAGSTITSVTLRLNMSRTVALAQPCALHRATLEWGEGTSDAAGEEGSGAEATPGDATWLHAAYDTSLWAAAGGDFAPTASASVSVTGLGPYSWSSAAMAADVQSWLDDPSGNHGWVLIGNEAAGRTAKRWDSREHPTAANRPALTVVFTPPASCPIDYVPDGTIDFLDYLEFLNRYDAQDPTADLNGDGAVDFADYLEFLNLYDGGC